MYPALLKPRNPAAPNLIATLLQSAILALDAGVSLQIINLSTTQRIFDQGQSVQLLNVAAMAGNSDLAEAVFSRTLEWQFNITTDHCIAYLKTLARDRKVDRTFKVMNELIDLGVKFDFVQLQMLVNEFCSSSARVDDAFFAVKKLADERVLHIEAVNAVILACACIGDSSRALNVFETINKICATAPDTISYNALLRCTSHPTCVDHQMASTIFSLMREHSVAPVSVLIFQ